MMRNMRSIVLVLAAGLTLGACQQTPPPAVAKPAGLSAEQIAVLREQGFVEGDDGWSFGIPDRLLFPTDGSSLVPDQATRITGIAEALSRVGIDRARVEGHTDTTGSAAYNRTLSHDRAEAVAGALERGGMPRAGLIVVGLGESQPVESNATAAGRAENRRVVLIIPSG